MRSGLDTHTDFKGMCCACFYLYYVFFFFFGRCFLDLKCIHVCYPCAIAGD